MNKSEISISIECFVHLWLPLITTYCLRKRIDFMWFSCCSSHQGASTRLNTTGRKQSQYKCNWQMIYEYHEQTIISFICVHNERENIHRHTSQSNLIIKLKLHFVFPLLDGRQKRPESKIQLVFIVDLVLSWFLRMSSLTEAGCLCCLGSRFYFLSLSLPLDIMPPFFQVGHNVCVRSSCVQFLFTLLIGLRNSLLYTWSRLENIR